MITGTTRFDLSRSSRTNDRRVIRALYAVPAGTRVILYFGARHLVDCETARHVEQYVTTLHVDVQGETEAVHSWVSALRGSYPGSSRWSA